MISHFFIICVIPYFLYFRCQIHVTSLNFLGLDKKWKFALHQILLLKISQIRKLEILIIICSFVNSSLLLQKNHLWRTYVVLDLCRRYHTLNKRSILFSSPFQTALACITVLVPYNPVSHLPFLQHMLGPYFRWFSSVQRNHL